VYKPPEIAVIKTVHVTLPHHYQLESLTKTNFRSMRIFLKMKILMYDNLTKN